MSGEEEEGRERRKRVEERKRRRMQSHDGSPTCRVSCYAHGTISSRVGTCKGRSWIADTYHSARAPSRTRPARRAPPVPVALCDEGPKGGYGCVCGKAKADVVALVGVLPVQYCRWCCVAGGVTSTVTLQGAKRMLVGDLVWCQGRSPKGVSRGSPNQRGWGSGNVYS